MPVRRRMKGSIDWQLREREANWRASETDHEREHRLIVMRERLTNVPVRQRMKGNIDWQLREREKLTGVLVRQIMKEHRLEAMRERGKPTCQ